MGKLIPPEYEYINERLQATIDEVMDELDRFNYNVAVFRIVRGMSHDLRKLYKLMGELDVQLNAALLKANAVKEMFEAMQTGEDCKH